MRVVDLGVDPTTRMFDVLASLLMVIGIFGPLLFVRSWAEAIGRWIDKNYPFLADWVANAHQSRLGRLVLNKWIGRGLMALVLLSFLIWLTSFFPLMMVIIFGPVVSVLLLANLLDLDQELPEALHLPHLGQRRVIAFFGMVIILFMLILGAEVWIKGPDLRTDGLHGFLVPEVLGFSASPITLYDLDGNLEPLGALYLGGNADLYVLYDPCAETVRFVPVGSSRVEFVDRVACPKTE